MTPRVTLVGKPGCHLCDVVREVIEAVCAQTGDSYAEVSIYDDLTMADLYWEQIPVTLVDGEQIAHWTLEADALRAALARPAPG